jgi:serine phosphatase RsbU (regulator of sigma subunit)
MITTCPVQSARKAVRLTQNDAPPSAAADGVSPGGRAAGDSGRRAGEPPSRPELNDVQAIADAALSRRDPQAFLDDLVDRVKEALGAETAAILLLDRRSDRLAAAAASGLEEEVRQGVRIPVGRGFAGRVAAEQRPVILDDVSAENVINPILLARGVRSLMGAPLVVDGEVIGVLHVGTLTPRKFTSQDAGLLQSAADRAALAVRSLTAQADRAAAAALQASLVPSGLPEIDGLEMAGRYVPGSGIVGGDWYDAFALPGGQACAVIGDVAGSGLPAAVIMGRIRSALRAYALETTDPAEILARLDRKIRHFEPDAMATVLCAVFDPDRAHLTVSCAGHLPPIIALPGQAARPAETVADLMLGVAPQERRAVRLAFPPGAAACLYTDGLVERRGLPIDETIAQLCAAVSAAEPDAACAAVMAAMVGDTAASDDTALLMIRRTVSPG